jgi:hypothetical protein
MIQLPIVMMPPPLTGFLHDDLLSLLESMEALTFAVSLMIN